MSPGSQLLTICQALAGRNVAVTDQATDPVPDQAPGVALDEQLGAVERARRNGRFLWSMITMQPKLFGIAVGGAAVFAVFTVASSFAISWVIDNVILPRFEEGDVALATFLTGVAMVLGIGVLRAVAIVVRRSYASITSGGSPRCSPIEVVDRYVHQPMSWHNRRADGDLVARAGVDAESTVSVLGPIPFAVGNGRHGVRLDGLDAGHRRDPRCRCRDRVPAARGHQRGVRAARLGALRSRSASTRRVLRGRPRELRGCAAREVVRRRGT